MTQKNYNKVIFVSASIEGYLKKWCEVFELDLISTKMEVIGHKISGKFSTPNCNGIKKVKRIKREINLSEYIQIYAYGNSKDDLPMLNLADCKYYKCINKTI